MIDFDALEKEMAELNEKKKVWDKAWDRIWEIWSIVTKHENEYCEWRKSKQTTKE